MHEGPIRRPPDAHSCLISPSKKTAPAYSEYDARRKSPHGYPVPIQARVRTHIFTHARQPSRSVGLPAASLLEVLYPFTALRPSAPYGVSYNSSSTFPPVPSSVNNPNDRQHCVATCLSIYIFNIERTLIGITKVKVAPLLGWNLLKPS